MLGISNSSTGKNEGETDDQSESGLQSRFSRSCTTLLNDNRQHLNFITNEDSDEERAM
jgi:hypothetical protein